LGEFARLAGVHPKTVQRWDRDGTLPAHRTPTGRRFYTEEDRRKLLSLPQPLRRSVAYCRISSAT
jgi:putative resolvase